MPVANDEPELFDTRHDQRLSRLSGNKVIKVYPVFRDFYGLEELIEQDVSYFRHSAQALEERRQILHLLGPVDGGKSSIAERLKQHMDRVRSTCSRTPRSTSRRWTCSKRPKTDR